MSHTSLLPAGEAPETRWEYTPAEGWPAVLQQDFRNMAAVQKGMIYGTDNSYIVDAADLFPDRMRAIIIVEL